MFKAKGNCFYKVEVRSLVVYDCIDHVNICRIRTSIYMLLRIRLETIFINLNTDIQACNYKMHSSIRTSIENNSVAGFQFLP